MAVHQSRSAEQVFDAFSVALATGTSRRQVLRVLALALGGLLYLPGSHGALLALADACCDVEYPPADLADCPNKRPHPGNVRTHNGCGPEGGIRPAQGFGNANFEPFCNVHDECYETCNKPKGDCDGALGASLRKACRDAYPDNQVLTQLKRNACLNVAGVYFDAVWNGGKSAYEVAQKKDCECCRPRRQVICNCTKKCFDTAVACTSACKATLGCFTGICRGAVAGDCPACG